LHRFVRLQLQLHTTFTMMPRASSTPHLQQSWCQTGKPYSNLIPCKASHLHSLVGFMPQQINCSPLSCETQIKKPSWWFCGPNHKTAIASFKAQTEKPKATGFKVKLGETVDLDFEAKLRNMCSSSPCARCRPHIALPDLSIIWQPSTRPMVDYSGPLHQVFYSCHVPHRCPPCRTCHLHTTRQANAIQHKNR
jgi:hypothetical protein